MEVIKPKIDHNEYKFIELDNKLQVLMIYDKDADKSAAAMTINVGFYNDPEDTQGLAHFLEHMLFMGTHKYTQENYFHKFINDSGGIANAFTMEETTTFFYQVLNQHFTKSLEVFSEFFIDPM
jgi:secreted Zn-dependent insulinase-like peptidase